MSATPLLDRPDTPVVSLPDLDIGGDFPDNVWIATDGRRHAIYAYGLAGRQFHGVACTETESAISRFALLLGVLGVRPERVTFDEAREIAKRKGLPVAGLILIDVDPPVIHYVVSDAPMHEAA